jgi:ATP-dependent Lhr-like helicase
MTSRALEKIFALPATEVEAALLAMEAEGFVLRGKFNPGAVETEWCDRRLLARIHRRTITRLRAEIEPVSIAVFQRFLLVWQKVQPEDRVQGPHGLQALLEQLDGYEIPAGAWEPEVLAIRIKDYSPQWLDQLCFRGLIGWGRLSPPQNPANRPSAPVRSSPVSLFTRENLAAWLALSPIAPAPSFTPDTERVFEALLYRGALFFGELAKLRGLLPSRVEQALAELVAQGWVTNDSFEGLRALLIPQEKRARYAGSPRQRRHKPITSLEFAGRWSLLRHPSIDTNPSPRPSPALRSAFDVGGSHPSSAPTADDATETFARTLLRRYGVVFRRLLDRESLKVSWFELGRVFRRLEARGEIRGGYFVGGVSGEQFALPEAIGLLRSIRKQPASGNLIAISGADPLNLSGILTPGPRVSAIAANRILLKDGEPIAALEAGHISMLNGVAQLDRVTEHALRIGSMPAPLRPYYT